MKQVLIKILGTQAGPDGEEPIMELVTEAKYYEKENAVYLIYEETEISGLEGCMTTLRIKKDEVRMKRSGEASHEMVFIKGKRFEGLYETPMGPIEMEILTNHIDNQFDEAGSRGKLTIEYEISLRGLQEATNKLIVEILKEKTPKLSH